MKKLLRRYVSFHRIIFNLWRSGEAMNDPYSNPTAYQSAASVGTHPEGTAMDASVKAWTDTGPLPYRDDTNPPPHWFWGDIYKRMKRRPRCDGGED